MRKALLLFLLLFTFRVAAQNYTFQLNGTTVGNVPEITVSDFSFFVVLDETTAWPSELKVTFYNNRSSSVFFLQPDEHSPSRTVSQLAFASGDFNRFEVNLPAGLTATLHIYDPGETTLPLRPVVALTSSATCLVPAVITRENWCPAGDCDPVSPAVATDVTHLIVHHSAGTNDASDWAAIVRAIRNAHVNGNGWDDVGYNYLIDPNGLIYVGRGNDTRGAHFCGDNTGTMGTCMLGNFTSQTPTVAAQRALERLLAWKASERNIDPLTTSFHAAGNQDLNNIAGHRQGCSTACPGDSFFPLFDQLRSNVADTIAACEPVSVVNNVNENTLRFYPNPSHGNIKVAGFTGEGELSIFTASGQQILSRKIRAGDFIEANLFPKAGIYFAVVRDDAGVRIQKLIRQ